jgi:eukaryotic-like serine/threonine-protein kinase
LSLPGLWWHNLAVSELLTMTQRETTQVYEFGGFRLDPLRRVLSREDGEPIALKPRVLDALLYLVEHAGEPLDKTELIEGIWPGLVVEENNLNKAISVLRRVLGETPNDHNFIVTEPGHGYRFVATVVRRARDSVEPTPAVELPSIAQTPRPRIRIAMRYAGVAVVAAAAALAAVNFLQDRVPAPVPGAVRFQIEAAQTLNPLNIALSPDGTQIAYVGETERGNALWVRALGSLEARVVRGAEGVTLTSYPFWSADGAQLAYRTTHTLERVNVAGGLRNTIVDDLKLFRRAAWGKDGTILFGTEKVIERIPAAGGVPVTVTTLDAAAGETAHSAPQFLPDGKHFLYKASNVDWRRGAIFVGSLDPDERPQRLLEASRAIYVEPGYLVYSEESALYARKFDAARLAFGGPPAQIADDVFYRDSIDTSAFEAASTTLIYRAVAKDPPSPLLWVDRDGTTTTAASSPVAPGNFRLSPDAHKIVYDEGNPPDVWVLDLERGARTRITSDPQAERGALWSPDGNSIVFDAHRDGGRALYEKRADGTTPEKLLFAAGAHNVAVTDWSDDGRFIIFEQDSCLGCDMDVWVLPRAEGAEPYRFAATSFDEYSGVLSPDGRWMAYVTFESGICEVVVQPFADPAAGKWQVSANGGWAPRWSPDGRELYYYDGVQSIVRVEVATEPAFHIGKAVRVSQAPAAFQWDVARDGQRLLRTSGVADRAERAFPITVILNWTALIED